MTRETTAEGFQPALLERLTDHEPDRDREPLSKSVLRPEQLRDDVRRELAWLLGATRPTLDTALPADSPVRTSVLNYGLPALPGRVSSPSEQRALELAIRGAILTYEPRILPDTLTVEMLVDQPTRRGRRLDDDRVVGVVITGQIWGDPAPLDLIVRTQIDFERRRIELEDEQRSSGRER